MSQLASSLARLAAVVSRPLSSSFISTGLVRVAQGFQLLRLLLRGAVVAVHQHDVGLARSDLRIAHAAVGRGGDRRASTRACCTAKRPRTSSISCAMLAGDVADRSPSRFAAQVELVGHVDHDVAEVARDQPVRDVAGGGVDGARWIRTARPAPGRSRCTLTIMPRRSAARSRRSRRSIQAGLSDAVGAEDADVGALSRGRTCSRSGGRSRSRPCRSRPVPPCRLTLIMSTPWRL